jgi:ABC-type antimicrobial peptide transport system permease subunit
MTLGRLLLRNLFFHWRGNLAVLLGVVVGTAVLTGALLVGDSLRGSLRQATMRQLGNIDHVLVAGRLFRQELTEELAADKAANRVTPALVLQGAITSEKKAAGPTPPNPPLRKGGPGGDPPLAKGGRGGVTPRAGRVTILGVGPDFWQLWPDGQPPLGAGFWQSDKQEVVLNAALARELEVGVGDPVALDLQKVSAIPRESILGQPAPTDVIEVLKLTVRAVVDDDTPGSRFTLNPSPATPRNAFVPLATLQQELIEGKEGRAPLYLRRPVNALLAEGGGPGLQAGLARRLDLDDWGLVLRGPDRRAGDFFNNLRPQGGVARPDRWPRLRDRAFAKKVAADKGRLNLLGLAAYYGRQHPYLSLESRQLFFDGGVAAAARQAARQTGLTAAPTLVYLADQIAAGDQREMISVEVAALDPAVFAAERALLLRPTNYVVVAALDPNLPPPLGPFLPEGVKRLEEDEIVLTQWGRMSIPPGSGVKTVTVRYDDPEGEGHTPRIRQMRVRGWVKLQGPVDDPDLAPPFPGITDQLTLQEWDPPKSLHFENRRVSPADEKYWELYRATPKAFVNLATGQKLWGSRFGSLTSIRLAFTDGKKTNTPKTLKSAGAAFKKRLRENLKPEQGGFVFDPIRERALGAAGGSNDFGLLFLSFSVFIILAALLLVGLLFRLNLDRRASEIGLLLATGVSRATVRWLLLAEGMLLAAVGGAVGLAGAVGYAWLLLEYLRAWWPGGLERSFLYLETTPGSFLVGYGAAFLVSALTIAWATRVLGKVSPRALLAGETAEGPELPGGGRAARRHWRWWVGGLSLAGAAACLVVGSVATDHEARAGSFFGSGFLLLIAGLAGVWAYLKRDRVLPSRQVATLGVRNATRHPVRSLLTVSLLASATFLVIAVESFHRDPGADFGSKDGGSGGFPLLGETEVPLFMDPGTPRGRDELDLLVKQAAPNNPPGVFQGVSFYSFRLRAGDDASCLNLAQPRRPRLLGAGPAFVKRGGFRFQATEAAGAAEKENPWLLLEQDGPDRAIPVIADATTATWALKTGLGQELEVADEDGRPVRLRLVGLLQESIFQSELVMSDANFRKLYGRQQGYNFFLIDAPPGRADTVKNILEAALANHGLTVTPTLQRIEAYLAVENTYLSTFQALGGLGLLLGALGLAVVLLRSVWERRGELALLRALGFRRSTLGWLVLAENGFLLGVGLLVGAGTALLAVAPPVLGGAGEVPWLRLGVLLGLVILVGLAAGAAAVASTLRAPLLPALRRE